MKAKREKSIPDFIYGGGVSYTSIPDNVLTDPRMTCLEKVIYFIALSELIPDGDTDTLLKMLKEKDIEEINTAIDNLKKRKDRLSKMKY